MFGEVVGPGPIDVVFLHGWARRGRDFAAVQQRLAARGWSSVALDLPGFGSSPPPSVAGGARYYATLVAPVLAELASPVVLVGHSFGGRIATVIAAQHAEHLRAVVLCGAPLLRTQAPTRPPWRYRALRSLHRRGWVSDERLEAAKRRYGSSDYRASSGIIRDVLVATVAEGYEDELRRLRIPVTFVWGELDGEAPVAVARLADELVPPSLAPRARVRVLGGVGHLVPLEDPESLVAAVVEFLS